MALRRSSALRAAKGGKPVASLAAVSREFNSLAQTSNRKSQPPTIHSIPSAGAPNIVPKWKQDVQSVPASQRRIPFDGATAAAYVAYAFSEQAFIYPITPATPLGDAFASWNAKGKKNLFGEICGVVQMQSEGGAAGALHGVVDVGTLATTFTSSQGLLLMIPNMFILAGALNPVVIHVAARAITKHALCIFGDHSDVMACRQTGFAILSSHNVQEAMDMALCSHVATLKSSVPFLCFQDGFRTSHEISKPSVFSYESMAQLIPWEELNQYRTRGLHPNRPHARQQGQFSDTFFQNAEAGNLYYEAVPTIVQNTLDDIGRITGRFYKIFDYSGHPEAEHIIVSMGSSCNVINEVVNDQVKQDRKIGQVKVHLFRPWDSVRFLESLPSTVKTISVLDRTKESGSREPLFLDVASTAQTASVPVTVLGGRYGLGQKDITPGMVMSIYKNAEQELPKDNFTVGIHDDVSFSSLEPEPEPILCPPGTKQCLFWGMGSDGTLSANKNVIKLIGTQTPQHVQAHFVYDSKKAGGCTVSHLRFGPERIESSYDISAADYISCSQTSWIPKFKEQMWKTITHGGTCVLNIPQKTTEEVNKVLPAIMKRTAAERNINFYTIDANRVAKECGLGRHTNNILSAVFFKLSNVLPVDEAIDLFKASMRKSYKAKGADVVNRNLEAVDKAFANLHKIDIPKEWLTAVDPAVDTEGRPAFCTEIMDPMAALDANRLPVSAFDPRGHFPTATTQYEKRGIALSVPVTDMDKCTQCNKCAAICPHAAIRPFLLTQVEADVAPETFSMTKAKGGVETAGHMYRMQVAPHDCTGCQACSNTCGDGALTMTTFAQVIDVEADNWEFGINIPDRGHLVDRSSVKGSQFQQAMLEFSGACEGCGETPYAKLVTQLFGERMLIANASGCSSVWSGTAGFSPFATNTSGQGPAYGRSLFEDAAEYGLGMAASVMQKRSELNRKVDAFMNSEEHSAIRSMAPQSLQEHLGEWLLHVDNPAACQVLSAKIKEDLKAIEEGRFMASSLADKSPKSLSAKAGSLDMFRTSLPKPDTRSVVLKSSPIIQEILGLQDAFIKVSSWIWGGDGWAYDIGFGGLDHVLAQSRKVDFNVLVMDTEGYSNTGGQVSKATNMGSVQKFAPDGYQNAKKDLGQIAMTYRHIYVGSTSIGADYGQCVKCFMEAEAYNGPSLLLAYSPCIEHKILFPRGLSHLEEVMKQAVEAGYWSLYRYNPALIAKGDNPFTLDSKRLSRTVEEFTSTENRFMTLHRQNPELARIMQDGLQQFVNERHDRFKALAAGTETGAGGTPLTILVGSDTGTTTELSLRAKKMAESRGYNVTVLDLDEIGGIEQLQEHQNIMVLCATAGEGDPPGNATKFFDMFEEEEFASDALVGMKYHVFALGDRGYRQFNSAGKFIDKKFEELGAERLQAIGLGDDQDDDKYDTAFGEWLPEFWTIQGAPEPKDDHLIPEASFKLEEVPASRWSTYQQISPPGTKMIQLEDMTRITHPEHDRIIRHLSFDIEGRDFSYLLGDALNVFPQNDKTRVNKFLEWYGLNPDAVYHVSPKAEVDKRRKVAYQRPLPTWQMFTEVVDIFGRPNKFFYKSLARFATDQKEQDELNLIAGDSDEGKQKYVDLATETVTFEEVLRKYPSAKPPLEQLLGMVNSIKPRLYSIASSQRAKNDKCELMIVINDWDTPGGKHQIGTSTDYIENMGLAWDKDNALSWSLPCQITTGTFNFPESMMTPMIMAGLGTGLAPFRAFIQEKDHFRKQGMQTGNMWLFYGCRYRAKDYCYGDELEAYEADGVLSHLRVAFSRDTKQKVYVQHKMQDAAGELCAEFDDKNGYFYLCGQAGAVETDIENAIKQSLVSGGNFTEETAAEYVEKMHEDGRYNLELY